MWTANKHMKRGSVSLIIRKIKFKATITYHTRMTKIFLKT